MRLTLGTPRVLDNDVWRFYADLVNAFGTTEEVPPDAGTSLGVGGTSAPDAISVKKFKHIETYASGLDYPAMDEIVSLRKKVIPDNLSYFYESGFCKPGVGDCEKYHDATIALRVWRPMQASDVTNYAARAADYNADVVKKRKGCGSECTVADFPPKPLRFIARAAGASWPSDLLIIVGSHTVQSKSEEGGCSGMGADFWSFVYSARGIYVDFVLVENASSHPITIDALVGKYTKSAELRPVVSEAAAGESIPIASDPLAVGQRMLIPNRIVLAAPYHDPEAFDEYKKSMEELHRLFGAKGYKKAVDSYNRIPQFKDYSYGPTLSIGGLVSNGTRLNFAKRQASNSIDLTTVAEIGSCPDLLSWDENDREWVEHGKVLHKAPSRDKRYTEARDFEGLRTRFRVEEREPEIARIENAALVVTFDGGETLRLAPVMSGAQASLRLELDLAWGERLDLNFRLPEGRSADRVVKSRLEITGYYERHLGVASDIASPPGASEGRPTSSE